MNTIDDFTLKKRKYMPTFPRAIGKPTVYIDGYPYDDEPMPAGQHQGLQVNILFDSLNRYYEDEPDVHPGVDCFVYYRDANGVEKCVSPDIFIAFGVKKTPPRYSFYTWAEGASPTVVFEFLSDSTADRDRQEKRDIYLKTMGVQEYFIHQPDPTKPAEFRGWRRTSSGGIEELPPAANGELFSEALNLLFRWEERSDGLRLLRAYLPDGTPLTTSAEEARLRKQAQAIAEEEVERRQISEANAAEANATAAAEAQRRLEAEEIATAEAQRRLEAEANAAAEAQRRLEAEEIATAEAQRRLELEAELERLRAQIV